MTILVTAIGTASCIVLTALTAYVLSKSNLPGVKIMNLIIVITMLFNGGLVATYISYVTIFHVKNTIFGLIVPNLLMNAFNIMLVRNYFSHSIPEEIYESARIDGASEFVIFFKLVLPLSVPILATVGLMSGIAYWNDWQNALYYIDDKSLYTVQAVLNAINESVAMLASLGGTAGASAADLPSTRSVWQWQWLEFFRCWWHILLPEIFRSRSYGWFCKRMICETQVTAQIKRMITGGNYELFWRYPTWKK